ncbi:MAG: class B sortase, partial [Oscillospiraceae bacterium]
QGGGMGMGTFVKAPPMLQKGSENFSAVILAFDKTKEKYPDACCWLQIPNTKINNVVMQSCDNSHYLRRDENGKDSIYGCYFADYACDFTNRDSLLNNTVIYGHSDLKDNPNGKRFSELFKFSEESFAKSNRLIYVTTQNEQLCFEVFAVFYTDTSFNYITPEIDGEETGDLGRNAKKRSLYDYGVEIGEKDKLLTLSTCSVKYGKDRDDIRFVVMARLLDEGEAESESFTVNPQPLEPEN